MENVLAAKNILIYLLAINIITFVTMWVDKKKAKKGSRRISEKTLFTLVFLGGGIGGIAGMYTFRHKTKKIKFVIGFPAIVIIETITIISMIFI